MAVIGCSRYPEPGFGVRALRRSSLPPRGDSAIPQNCAIRTGDVILDEIGEQMKFLLTLLEDPEFGLSTWHGFVKVRLERMHEIIGKALGK